MQGSLRAYCRLLHAAIGLAVVAGGAVPARAAPVSCPTTGAGGGLVWICSLSAGSTSIEIEAPGSLAPGPEEFVDWVVGGERLLFVESAFLFSGAAGSFTPLAADVLDATVDGQTNEVAISLAQSGVFDLLVTYRLQETVDGASVSKTFVLTPGPQGLSGRLYSFHDFDIDLSPAGLDSAQATAPDTIVQQGTESFPSLELFAADLPGGWEIEEYSSVTTPLVDRLAVGEAVTLSDTAGVVGPGDISSAFSWDFSLASQESLTVRLEQTVVMTPEPGATLLAWSAFLTIAATKLGQRRARRRRNEGAKSSPSLDQPGL